ncbi:NAD(P)-binding protein [Echria macrotheca]|uniref:NAD(P)-binding protein n=1 Tax=Echria macrotheca TaxID=438768 RepID=A0AAJ0B3L9_9PEZI|nr:NAD(P)-binding protein [Echria macrotheca]
MEKPTQRTVLITGCSNNSLGAALALAFHRTGNFRVLATGRNPSKLTTVKEAGLTTILLDTTSPESIAAAVSEVTTLTGGTLDILINNAGGGYSMPVLDIDLSKLASLFQLNVYPLITVTKAFLPLLQKSPSPIVVNHTSVAAFLTIPFSGAYSASKAAALCLTEALRLELAPFGVKVVALMTASVKSTFWENNPGEELPDDSIFASVARETVEYAMTGKPHRERGGMDADKWAAGVVRELAGRKPAHWVWGGQSAGLVRVAALLPVGTMDGAVRGMVGLDVIEERVKARKARDEE